MIGCMGSFSLENLESESRNRLGWISTSPVPAFYVAVPGQSQAFFDFLQVRINDMMIEKQCET